MKYATTAPTIESRNNVPQPTPTHRSAFDFFGVGGGP
jgi:hypothetical protein